MKHLLLIVLVCSTFMTSAFATSKLIVTTRLDAKNMPADQLTEIPFDKDHEYLMFIYNDDNTAFGVEKVYFEISIYDEETEKYKYSDLYTVDTKTDWGYCYKGILFNTPLKLKIKVFTDNGELATKYIEVVR